MVQVTHNVACLARWMAADLYLREVDVLRFEVSLVPLCWPTLFMFVWLGRWESYSLQMHLICLRCEKSAQTIEQALLNYSHYEISLR